MMLYMSPTVLPFSSHAWPLDQPISMPTTSVVKLTLNIQFEAQSSTRASVSLSAAYAAHILLKMSSNLVKHLLITSISCSDSV